MTKIPEEFASSVSGRYRIERELGRGGMAVVYLADDLKHGRKVAIKVLHRERAADIGQERFLREIEIAARLNHPHILALHDSGAADGHLYYVMPYLAEGSLRARLNRERQLPIEDALRIAREIASALGQAHRDGLVHRDIKPENILLSDGMALVADFGIARILSAGSGETTQLTASGVAVGTLTYMAPEQLTGTSDIDGRADLYALACVLYEMLTGKPPFTGPSAAVVEYIRSGVARPVTEARPNTPGSVAHAVAKGLSKLPSDRFANAARFAEALAPSNVETPASVPESHAIPNNLPRQRTSFVGREREIAECTRALDEARLLTITGIGGCGKTRLGLKLAETLMEAFPDGVWFAGMAPLKDEDRVALTLATTLEIREQPETPLLTTIAEHVRHKRTLILLDNCEHVLDAAAELTDALINAGPALKIIVTSREGLGVSGERLIALRSLSVPASSATTDLKAASASESVRLFVDRARALDAGFTLNDKSAPAVAEICRRLDGIPLAIELAAARTKALTVQDIAARLDDRFRLLTGGSKTALPRHQALRTTIQWSYDLLTNEEQRLFRLLSAFSGGWTLEAATRVAGHGEDEFEILECMTRLVDKSLIAMDRGAESESRYTMLETVRQFGLERLQDSGEGDATRDRHLGYFVEFAERAGSRLSGREQTMWFARLLQEQENLLAALTWCDRSPAYAELGLRLVGDLRRFWLSGPLDLGIRVMHAALDRPGAQEPTRVRAKALYSLANTEFAFGRYEDCRAHAEESLAIAREIRDDESICDGLIMMNHVQQGQNGFEESKATALEAGAIARRLGDRIRLARSLGGLAEAYRSQGDHGRAEPIYEEALELYREDGDNQNVMIMLCNLAVLAIERNSLEKARAMLAETVSLTDVRSVRNTAAVLDYLGAYFSASKEWRLAARFQGAGQGVRIKTGSLKWEPVDDGFLMGHVERTREALGDAAYEVARNEGRELGAEAATAEARTSLG